MPTIITVIRAQDFLRMTPEKTLNYEESAKLFNDLSTVPDLKRDYQIILDTRKIETVMATVDLFNLAHKLLDHGLAFKQRTAVLCQPEQLEGARFFEALSQNQGYELRAFVSYEEAVDWLCSSSETRLG